MNVLLIEDERKAADELKLLIAHNRADWVILDVLISVEESLEWFAENKMPDLIFSDIQLADGVSFQIFERINITCPIIFFTAFDEYAIKAFETNGLDYLLKPIDKAKLKKALDKLDNLTSFFTKRATLPDLNNLLTQIKYSSTKTLLVSQREKIIPVKYSDVVFFFYNQGMVTLNLFDGKTYHLPKTLEEIETEADPSAFYRVNRQFLINRKAVKEIEYYFARKLLVRLSAPAPEKIIVSKAKASEFKRWLES